MKKFKLNKRDINETIGVLAIFLGFFCLWCGFNLYYLGFHNIDLAFNALGTGVFNLTTMDKNSDFQGRTLADGYINGINQTRYSLQFFFLSALSLMSGIYLMTRR